MEIRSLKDADKEARKAIREQNKVELLRKFQNLSVELADSERKLKQLEKELVKIRGNRRVSAFSIKREVVENRIIEESAVNARIRCKLLFIKDKLTAVR